MDRTEIDRTISELAEAHPHFAAIKGWLGSVPESEKEAFYSGLASCSGPVSLSVALGTLGETGFSEKV